MLPIWKVSVKALHTLLLWDEYNSYLYFPFENTGKEIKQLASSPSKWCVWPQSLCFQPLGYVRTCRDAEWGRCCHELASESAWVLGAEFWLHALCNLQLTIQPTPTGCCLPLFPSIRWGLGGNLVSRPCWLFTNYLISLPLSHPKCCKEWISGGNRDTGRLTFKETGDATLHKADSSPAVLRPFGKQVISTSSTNVK